MMPIQSLHHLSFRVPELEPALGFWRDLLGFAPIERPELGIAGAWLRGHGLEVHLIVQPGPASETQLNPIRNHVAFAVADLDAARERLTKAGLEVLSGRPTQLWVLDPGANVVEFIAGA
ncbi:MAG: VOC family protein [Caulobacteraceae bacterium]